MPEEAPVVIAGAGPGGLTAAYQLTKRGVHPVVLEADAVVGGISRTVRARRLALRPGRPPLLHQGARGRGAVARDPARGRLPPPPPHEPHLLQGQVLRLPAQGPERPAQPGPVGVDPVRLLLHLGPHPAAQGPGELRELAGGPLRLAPLPHLLQDLHRAGVGRRGLRDAGRLGRPAHQEPRPAQGGRQRHPAQAQPDGDHHPHRGVPVPQVRPRDDVGGLRGEGGGRRGDGAPVVAAHQDQGGRRAGAVGHLRARARPGRRPGPRRSERRSRSSCRRRT